MKHCFQSLGLIITSRGLSTLVHHTKTHLFTTTISVLVSMNTLGKYFNSSTLSFASTSITTIAAICTSTPCNQYPKFIRPTSNTQNCDIYGALCQPGSITVDLNLTSTIVPTVVPCSYYLSAQSKSALAESISINTQGTYVPDQGDWLKSFGRTPQCSTLVNFAPFLEETGDVIIEPDGQVGEFSGSTTVTNNIPITATTCGLSNPGSTLPVFLFEDSIPSCCGQCFYESDGIRLIYFAPEMNQT